MLWDVLLRLAGTGAGDVVAHPSSSFHAMQRDIEQQRADHPAQRSTFLGGGEPAIFDYTRFQPVPHQTRAGEGAQRLTDVLAVEPIKRTRSPPPPASTCQRSPKSVPVISG